MIATNKKVVVFTVLLQLFSSLLPAQEQDQPEMVVQLGHSTEANSVAFSPDNRFFLSASIDEISLWNTASGKEMRKMKGHRGIVYAVEFLPGGATAVSSGWDHTIRIWDISRGVQIDGFTLKGSRVLAIDVLPGEDLVLCGCSDGSLFLLDYKEGRIVRSYAGNTSHVSTVCFSEDGEYFLSGGGDSVVRLWNTEKGTLVSTFTGHGANVFALDFSPDGKYIVSGGGFLKQAELKLWDIKSGKLLKNLHGHEGAVNFAAFSSDGSTILSGSDDGTIRYWDVATGEQLRVVGTPSGRVKTAGLSSYGRVLVTGGSDPYLYLWDAGAGELLRKAGGVSSPVNTAAFSPGNRRIVTGGDSGSFFVWDLQKACRDVGFSGHTKGVTGVSFSRDGRRILSASIDKTVKLWDAETEELLKTFTGHEDAVFTAVLSPDGRKVLSAGRNNVVKVWDAESGQPLKTIRGEEKEAHFCFSPDGSRVLIGLFDGSLRLWDLAKGTERAFPRGHPEQVTAVGFSHNGRLALSGGRDGTVRLWDVHTGSELGILSRHDKTVNSVAFSSDMKYVLSAGDDAKTIMHDLHTSHYSVFVSSKDQEDWLVYTDKGNWDSSMNGGELVAMVSDMECWNVDQFAVRNNRPDLILQGMPEPEQELIDHFYAQYCRRLHRLGMNEADVDGEYHVPKAAVDSSRQQGKYIDLAVRLEDQKVDLRSYNIYVNDVPLFGAYGKKITGRRAEIKERIQLTEGENKIEVSCMNAAGAESYRPAVYAGYDRKVEGDLYFIGFGVSEYENTELNLRYADRDAEDLKHLFESAGRSYSRIIARTYKNEKVVRNNIKEVKDLLMEASVDDTVVLFISGHGVHDRDEYATYYFLTHDTELGNLAQTAINFEQLEDLLQGIPPREKLFLMDTCGSGEWEPAMVQKVVQASGNKGVWARIPEGDRGLTQAAPASPATAQAYGSVRTYLYEKDRYIYNDLVRRSGAIVFSSCRGDEVLYESSEYENGLFTEYIIRAFGADGNARPADTDGDGLVSTEELRQYVRTGVARETEEDPLLYAVPQHPTVDRDNIYVEFGF
jgi:WD40 repeat protein